MPTISENLAQLQQDRNDLVDNLTTMGIEDLTGDETFTELVPKVLDIEGGGGGASEYFTSTISAGQQYSHNGIALSIKKVPIFTVSGTSMLDAFCNCRNLVEIPLIDTSNVTNMRECFRYCQTITTCPLLDTRNVTDMFQMFAVCSNLISVPQFNTQSVSNFNEMFTNCSLLTTVPQFNTQSATSLGYMFSGCNSLTSESLNNILGMCANVNANYSRTKTLYDVFGGNKSSVYPASTIQNLSNYQDFIDAGWTIGWS